MVFQSSQINPYLRIDRSTQTGEVGLTLRGDPGEYRIEYTNDPDLGSWALFQNLQLNQEFLTISAPIEGTARFYRATFLSD